MSIRSKRPRKSDEIANINKKARIELDDWVSATSTRNWVLGDPIQDWLNFHATTLSRTNPEYKLIIDRASASQRSYNSFGLYVLWNYEI